MEQITSTDEAAFGRLLASYRKSARQRRIAWRLTRTDFARLVKEPCHFCRVPPEAFPRREGFSGFVHGAVSRVDNKGAFDAGNAVPCCTPCCNVKDFSSYDETMEWIHRLVAFQALKHVETPDDMFGPEA